MLQISLYEFLSTFESVPEDRLFPSPSLVKNLFSPVMEDEWWAFINRSDDPTLDFAWAESNAHINWNP